MSLFTTSQQWAGHPPPVHTPPSPHHCDTPLHPTLTSLISHLSSHWLPLLPPTCLPTLCCFYSRMPSIQPSHTHLSLGIWQYSYRSGSSVTVRCPYLYGCTLYTVWCTALLSSDAAVLAVSRPKGRRWVNQADGGWGSGHAEVWGKSAADIWAARDGDRDIAKGVEEQCEEHQLDREQSVTAPRNQKATNE